LIHFAIIIISKCRYLYERGASPTSRRNGGRTPLISAAFAENGEDVAIYLLNTGAVNYRARDNDGRTAVWAAAQTGKLRLLEQLVERGADLSRKDERGKNARDAADKAKEKETLKYIDSVNPSLKSIKS
jgi:ankyrin repeat protein